jgi:wyosine [tRNA(Phe)-imidazoG37] synthetase (radical SAM superfamily)
VNVLPLQKGILYGPINSRRLGKSLGINLMPTDYKLCSFNCVYCHYGWTKVHTRQASRFLRDLPEFDDIIEALRKALISKQKFDYITFSGNGEPTLYPQFASLASRLAQLRDRYRPEVKIALLSNTCGLNNAEVRKSITYINLPVFKLDAGTERTFNEINRPTPGVHFKEICGQLSALSGFAMQTVLVRGRPCNTTEEELGAYFEKIRLIQPDRVHIYSIDRPVPDTELERVLPDRLEEIAQLGREKTGVEVQAFYLS